MGTENISAEHVLSVYKSATEEERSEGADWYQAAHTFARGMSDRYGLSLAQSAGIIAALSPRLSWDLNMRAADTLARTGDCATLFSSKLKAKRILWGRESVESVLQCPRCQRKAGKHVCSGQKVRAFFACILAAGECDSVCIDRHAFDIAAGHVTDDVTRKLLDRRGGYDTVANAYREAARIAGVSASTVQAVTWVAWRNAKRAA